MNTEQVATAASIVAASAGGAACGECGHLNPASAQFCNQCGRRIASAPETTGTTDTLTLDEEVHNQVSVSSERPSSEPGRRALILSLAAVGAVVLLWGLTWWSGQSPVTAPAEAGTTGQAQVVGPASPIPDGPAPVLPDTMQTQADRLEGLNTAEGWYEAGRYFLTAAFEARETNPQASVQWARRAVEDFEKSLAIEESVDVRFALAEATQYDPAQPMRVVVELRSVLEADPNHIGANFLMGERRFLIGRLDSARVSLEKVLDLADPFDPIRGRAQEVLAAVTAAQGAAVNSP